MYDTRKRDIAKGCDIGAILKAYGHNPSFKRIGTHYFYHSPFHEDATPSLSVDKNNMWKDFGDTTGRLSGDAINLVEYLGNVDYISAISIIYEIMGKATYLQNITEEKVSLERRKNDGSQTKVLCVGTITNAKVMSYLNKRGIPKEVYSKYLLEIKYSCQRDAHISEYTAFCIRTDSDTYSVHGLPMPGTKYEKGIKRFIGPGDVSTFHIHGSSYSSCCMVFEGQINMLSWIVMYGEPQMDIIVLNSVTNLPKLADLASHAVSSLYCYLDNDQDGRKATANMPTVTGCEVYDCSSIYAEKGLNDLNDLLLQKKA